VGSYIPKDDPVEKLLRAWTLRRANRGPSDDPFQETFNRLAEEGFFESAEEGMQPLVERYQAMQALISRIYHKARDQRGYGFRREDVAHEIRLEMRRIRQIGMSDEA
jgi:hypothetical protein